jgi:hypothetical protein
MVTDVIAPVQYFIFVKAKSIIVLVRLLIHVGLVIYLCNQYPVVSCLRSINACDFVITIV